MDLRSRYVLIVAGGLVIATLALLGLGAWQDARYFAADASDRLEGIGRAQRLVEQQKNAEIVNRAELLANNQAVVSYIVQALSEALPGMEQDSASIVDLLTERRDQIGLGLIAVLDGQGRVVATTERFSANNDLSQAPLFQEAKQGKTASNGLWLDENRLLHVAILPLAAYGYNEVFLLVGMPVNQLLAQSISELARGDVAFVAVTSDGPLITASTLDPALQDAVLSQLPSDKSNERIEFSIAGQRYYASSTPLFGSTTGQLVALVSPSSEDPSAAALRLPMVVGGIIALISLALLAWLLWIRVFSPAEWLATIIDHAAVNDDLHLRAQVNGAAPVARLAAAFNRLLPVIERRKRRRTTGSAADRRGTDPQTDQPTTGSEFDQLD